MKKFIVGKLYLSKLMKKETVLFALNAEELDEQSAEVLSFNIIDDDYSQLTWKDFSTEPPTLRSGIFEIKTVTIPVWECVMVR